jgi:leucyl aminopeptidase
MRVSVSDKQPEQVSADAYVVLFRRPARGRLDPPLAAHLRPDAARLINHGSETLTWLETRDLATPRVLFWRLPSAPAAWDPELEYLGGHAGSFDQAEWATSRQRQLRSAGAAIERACTQAGLRHVALIAWPEDVEIEAFVTGAGLRAHDPRAWERSTDGPVATTLRRLTVVMGAADVGERRAMSARLREARIVVDATNFARELADLPGNLGTPAGLVERVHARLDDHHDRYHDLRASTLSAATLAGMGMGLFTAVDAGAPARGCLLRLDYDPFRGAEPEAPILALVGKGLTHDTGGYNLKTSATIHELTYDKAGAAAVIGAILAIAELRLPLRVLGLCPLTENCIDAKAYKPGDVLTAYNGTTVYVENTDAEGRLVLADVLAWLRDHEPRPELVIDLATLTWTIHAALGEPFAGLYCNEDRARDGLVAAGKSSGELVWPMPIHDIHDRDLGHHKADLRNIGVAAGAPSSAAAFLRAFVDYPWAHLDISGKVHAEFARECFGPGATGFGVRLLVDFARRMALTEARGVG